MQCFDENIHFDFIFLKVYYDCLESISLGLFSQLIGPIVKKKKKKKKMGVIVILVVFDCSKF